MIGRLALLLAEVLDLLVRCFWGLVLIGAALVWVVALWGMGYVAVLSAGAAP